MTSLSPEQTPTIDFDATYARTRAPVMRAIEGRVLGCDYGGSSWTARDEADAMVTTLGLAPGMRLLDIGAGVGWPGIYISDTSGCDVTLVDMAEVGLRIAAERIATDDLTERCRAVLCDCTALPFKSDRFDAVWHSDVLCCLPDKAAVLRECRRIIQPGGHMVFAVVSVTAGLGTDDHARAVASGTPFVEAEASYPDLLRATGWTLEEDLDQTDAYIATCRRQIEADTASRTDLRALLGDKAYDERLAKWHGYLGALTDGLLCRHRFTARPAA